MKTMPHLRTEIKRFILALTGLLCCLPLASAEETPRIAIVVHGGAGTIAEAEMSPEKEASYKAKLEEALRAGHSSLQRDNTSLDAVVAAITILEDSPLFNAGKGAVFTHDGANELDASIMDGATLRAGAVAGVRHIANPITLARRVMDHSPHVLMVGSGAEEFALDQGMSLVSRSYFHTQHRWEQLQRALRSEQAGIEKSSTPKGTVGAVALDKFGNLAAGTSTGGMTNKKFGRVGDSPIIGAGTYANNATLGVSGTGHGEYFIRSVVGYDISALIEYAGMSLQDAVRTVVLVKLVERGGEGGVIAMNARGEIAMEHNTPGMYRGSIDANGELTVSIFADSL